MRYNDNGYSQLLMDSNLQSGGNPILLRERRSNFRGLTNGYNSYKLPGSNIQTTTEDQQNVGNDEDNQTTSHSTPEPDLFHVVKSIIFQIYHVFIGLFLSSQPPSLGGTIEKESSDNTIQKNGFVTSTTRAKDSSNDIQERSIVQRVNGQNEGPTFTKDLVALLNNNGKDDSDTESESDGLAGPEQYGTTFNLVKQLRDPTPLLDSGDLLLQMSDDSSIEYRVREMSTPRASISPSIISSPYHQAIAKFYLPHTPVSKYSIVDTLIKDFRKSDLEQIDEDKQRQQLITKERESATSLIKPLSSDQQAKLYKIWSTSNQSIIVSSHFQIDITVRDLQTLCDNQWLNDNVIDFYLNLITEQSSNVFCWTTHFFTTLQSKGYQGVARWSKRKKLNVTQKDLILVPINIMGTHWALAVVDNVKKKFAYYDSLSSSGNKKALQLLVTYMSEEGKKQGSSIDFHSYEIIPLAETPQQQNGYDCGVFSCTSAFFVSKGKPLKFSQKDMKLLRRKMAYEILTKELIK
ncbi:hypothetical protein CAAN1_04S01134 [[Candida] anglica]|uniref:Ubiquitin-like protease family profile domain-containing protein n=1 Tax=[Candida] anglica TaxID=148631 RepID=A0ABP0E957_9ASCO